MAPSGSGMSSGEHCRTPSPAARAWWKRSPSAPTAHGESPIIEKALALAPDGAHPVTVSGCRRAVVLAARWSWLADGLTCACAFHTPSQRHAGEPICQRVCQVTNLANWTNDDRECLLLREDDRGTSLPVFSRAATTPIVTNSPSPQEVFGRRIGSFVSSVTSPQTHCMIAATLGRPHCFERRSATSAQGWRHAYAPPSAGAATIPGHRTPPGQMRRRLCRSLGSRNRQWQRLLRPGKRVNSQPA